MFAEPTEKTSPRFHSRSSLVLHHFADLFHYIHHYRGAAASNVAGFSAGWLDVVFGTFVGSLASEKDGVKQRPDAKSTLRGAPSLSFSVHLLISSIVVVAPFFFAIERAKEVAKLEQHVKLLIAFVAGFGPQILAMLMAKNESFTPAIALQFVIGNIVSVLPISIMAYYMMA
jgi:hypothetical protein